MQRVLPGALPPDLAEEWARSFAGGRKGSRITKACVSLQQTAATAVFVMNATFQQEQELVTDDVGGGRCRPQATPDAKERIHNELGENIATIELGIQGIQVGGSRWFCGAARQEFYAVWDVA